MSQVNKSKSIVGWISFVILAIIGIIALGSSIYTVDAGETAIVTRYGEIVDQKTSGLNMKSPVEDVTYFSTREQKVDFGEFDKSSGDVISGLSAYTSDRQTATVALTVTYQITDPEQVYVKYKSTENMINTLLTPRVRQQLEIVFSKYTSITAVENRGQFATQLRQEISKTFEGYPLIINDVQSVFNFSAEYERMIEDSVNKDVAVRNKARETRIAEEEAKAAKERAQGEAQAALIKAQAEADIKRLTAESEAHAIAVKGKAEADAQKALAEALSKNQDLVALKAVEKWQGHFPTYLPQGSILPIQMPGIGQVAPATK